MEALWLWRHLGCGGPLVVEALWLWRPLGNCPAGPVPKSGPVHHIDSLLYYVGGSKGMKEGFFYMHHPADRIAHITGFVTPVVEQWLEREIAQSVHPMKD